MVGDRVLKAALRVLVVGLMGIAVSACYKDAGVDLQPTSRQVNLTDLTPATPVPPLPTATVPPAETATRTLVPTTTPADLLVEPPSATPTAEEPDSLTPAGTQAEATPSQFMPGITPATQAPVSPTVAITTPDMSDILASPSPTPTQDPNRPVTPTAFNPEQDECIHIVRPGDTLYSIAQAKSVLLADLVAANPETLRGNPNTVLQIGWQLRLPGCGPATPTPVPQQEATALVQPGGQIVHTVKPGEGIYSIARQYGVDPQALIAANNLKNPNLIYPGDQLIIPATP